MLYVHGPAVARTAHARSYRSPAAQCLVEVYLPGWPCERYRLGMPEIDDTSATARLLVESFEIVDDVAASNIATQAASAAPTPPTMPRDDLGLPMWPSPPLLDPMSLARWHVSFKGLHWRVNNRLYTPSLARSLQSSLVLAIQAKDSGDLVGCAELSLRPADGSLPGEFAPPAILLFAGSPKPPLTAYVSNLAVHGKHRRQRLATRLLAACEDIAAARWLCSDIYLHVSDQKCAAPPVLRPPPNPRALPRLPWATSPTYALTHVAPRSAAARVMYDREQYQPLPNFEQPTSAAGATNLYFRKRLDTAQGGGPVPLSADDLARCEEAGLGSEVAAREGVS